jgi:hypothetical protein
VVDRGPRPDLIEFDDVLASALRRHRFTTLLGDAGYESEGVHRRCREELGVRSIIPTTRRGRPRHSGARNAIGGRWRRQLHRSFPRRTYGQRWQIETVFSVIKRRLGSALSSRRPYALNREALLRVITYNLMLIWRARFLFNGAVVSPVFLNDRPGRWTSDDCEAAREQANRTARPWGVRGPTPEERWNGRRAITVEERERFRRLLEVCRRRVRADAGCLPGIPQTRTIEASLERKAVGRTLVACRLLRVRRRRITTPISRLFGANIS